MLKCRDPKEKANDKNKDPMPPEEVAMGDTFNEIATRLKGFRPGVHLEQHVKCVIKENDSILDGLTFRAKDMDILKGALRNCRNHDQKAFAEAKMENQKTHLSEKHFPIEASFLSTHGTGFREIWRGPLLSDRPLSFSDSGFDASFSGNFGNSVELPDIS